MDHIPVRPVLEDRGYFSSVDDPEILGTNGAPDDGHGDLHVTTKSLERVSCLHHGRALFQLALPRNDASDFPQGEAVFGQQIE